MDVNQIVDLCIRIFPEILLSHGRDWLIKNPQQAINMACVHIVACDIKDGKDYKEFQKYLNNIHIGRLENIAQARKDADEESRLGNIEATRRRIASKRKRGIPESQWTNEEREQDVADILKAEMDKLTESKEG